MESESLSNNKMAHRYFIGIDVGSSFVKTTVFDAEAGLAVGKARFPEEEQVILSPAPGWAEQDPEVWWQHFTSGLREIVARTGLDSRLIEGIGIAYQMHGLVLLDADGNVLRNSIIWCDSRAVSIGAQAFTTIGEGVCLRTILNSPGNFTASKLRWVQEHEPDLYGRAAAFMLPGDYLAFRLSGEMTTTASGLSEGMLWDFQEGDISKEVTGHYGIPSGLIPPRVPSIGYQSTVSDAVAAELGLKEGVAISYRAGDQPNNAFSLHVSNPGEVAVTAGTSAVIYAISDTNVVDSKSRINTFLHVNDAPGHKRNGVLVCLNGGAILYNWIRSLASSGGEPRSHEVLNALAHSAPAGSSGLHIFPFGNGAERILENRHLGGHIGDIDFNRHSIAHVARASMEGIVYGMALGLEILRESGVPCDVVRASYGNLFLSDTFRSIFVNVTGTELRLYETDGAEGAARGAALGAGFYETEHQAFESMQDVGHERPNAKLSAEYKEHFAAWKRSLSSKMKEYDTTCLP
jgi:xylulokinase